MAERDKVWDLYAGDAHDYNESVDVWYGDEGQHKSLHGWVQSFIHRVGGWMAIQSEICIREGITIYIIGIWYDWTAIGLTVNQGSGIE